MMTSSRDRRLRAVAAHLAAAAEASPKHPPLGSLEGDRPAIRAWTVAQLGTATPDGALPPATFRRTPGRPPGGG